MATVGGIARYSVTGLPETSLASAVDITATVSQVSFGRTEGRGKTDPGLAGEMLQHWWSSSLGELSLALDFSVTLMEAPVVGTGLLESDITLARVAACVAIIRALAERAQVTLPALDKTVIAGALAPDGTLSCPPPYTSAEIVRACQGVGAQCLIGPFAADDPGLHGLSVQPAHELSAVLRIALGNNPVAIMRLILEWLVLFDTQTGGVEAALWHEAERRAAENLHTLTAWFAEIQTRPPRSPTILAALTALQSLVRFQTGENDEAPAQTVSSFIEKGYIVTAIWLLTRWAFVLRERRQEQEADRCLERASVLQDRLPFTAPAPILLHQIGRALYYQGRFPHALEKYWQGWNFLQSSAANQEQRADVYNSAGKCFNDTYQFALALELFEHARRIRVALRQDDKLARTAGAMGETYWRVGDLENAEHCCRQNVEFSRQVGRARNDRHDEMRAANSLANVLFAQGKVDDAEALYRQTGKYYSERYNDGKQQEAGNLVYSIEGLARVAAARGQWDEVRQYVADTVAPARQSLASENPAVLPVALLAYLDALRIRRAGEYDAAMTRLQEAESLLQPLYPAERAMVVIEQAISALYAGLSDAESRQLIDEATDILLRFLKIAEQPRVVAAFALIRAEVEAGLNALGLPAYDLLVQDRQRCATLEEHFDTARAHLAASKRDEAVRALRTIQGSVVFFRDILRHVTV